MSKHNSLLRQLIVCLLLFGQFSCGATSPFLQKQPTPKFLEELRSDDIVIIKTNDGNTRKVKIIGRHPEHMLVMLVREMTKSRIFYGDLFEIRYDEIVGFEYVGTDKLNKGQPSEEVADYQKYIMPVILIGLLVLWLSTSVPAGSGGF